MARKQAIPIIRTKLHRPPVAKDLVCRKALHVRLDEGGHQALTLVSAPTGTFQSRLLVALCFMNWIAADLPAHGQTQDVVLRGRCDG
jgi:ATP/maltotriose-dependent transcriptional regulator MalT